MTHRVFAFFVLFVALSTPLYAQAGGVGTSSSLGDAPLELRPGDELRITVWRQPELSGDMAVAEEGYLVHPLYREIQVIGVPMAVVEDRLREVISRYETNAFFVTHPMIRVAVGGEVRTPNLYSIPPETTIAQAVALAGGPTERGRMDRVRLIRGGVVHVLNLTRFDQGAGATPVRSGDEILLGVRRESVFRTVIIPFFSFVAAGASLVNIFL